ncbi:GGDEF domain-containing protein [Novosphingobium sp. RD2P27]|uniref:diguanylate cyclase n=1 Tax=Novosphingobium kalidii TaxID=3230299 RepID=A0ABV2CWB9_9SPHN
MTPADRVSRAKGLFSRLGFAPGRRDEARARGGTQARDGEDHQIRRELLADISNFILTHDLEVNASTLRIAFDLITGTDEQLSVRVEERVAAGEPITVEWLEDIALHSPRDEGEQGLQELVAELGTTMGAFARTASDARTATTQYSTALEQHAEDLSDCNETEVGEEITRVVREVLTHSRVLESELNRSEQEVNKLEKRLADARREAEIDFLTSLPNRRAFERIYEREVGLAAQNGEPICVAFCDIDHFKNVNDAHGHEAGDRVLRHVGETLASICNDTCHVARHGGEEFGVVLRGRNANETRALIDEVRADLASRHMVNRTTEVPFGQITFSAGIAEVHAYTGVREALRAADDALYQAKRTGRNRVVVASPAGS